MTKKRPFSNELNINEAAHIEAPSFFRRVANAVIAMVWGLLFAFVVLLLAWLFIRWIKISIEVSALLKLGGPILIGYLLICGILGFAVGDRFLESLKIQALEWFDVWYGLLPSWWKFK